MRISDWSSDVCSSDLHFHCLVDLVRVLDALDLAADFLADCHPGAPSVPVDQANDFLKAVTAAVSSSSAALSIALSASIFCSRAAWLDLRCWCRPCSKASTRMT